MNLNHRGGQLGGWFKASLEAEHPHKFVKVGELP